MNFKLVPETSTSFSYCINEKPSASLIACPLLSLSSQSVKSSGIGKIEKSNAWLRNILSISKSKLARVTGVIKRWASPGFCYSLRKTAFSNFQFILSFFMAFLSPFSASSPQLPPPPSPPSCLFLPPSLSLSPWTTLHWGLNSSKSWHSSLPDNIEPLPTMLSRVPFFFEILSPTKWEARRKASAGQSGGKFRP